MKTIAKKTIPRLPGITPGTDKAAILRVAAGSTVEDATVATISDGWHDSRGQGTAARPPENTARVNFQLHTLRSDLHGVVLSGGTIVPLSARGAQRMAAWLVLGQTDYARGRNIDSLLGTAVTPQASDPDKEHAEGVAQYPLRRAERTAVRERGGQP